MISYCSITDRHPRPNHERSLTSRDPETGTVSSQTKTKKRTRSSLPCAPVARRNGQQNTPVASSRRSSARISACALLTPDPSIELDQFQNDVDTGLHTSEDTPRLRKQVRFNFLDKGMSSLRPEVPPEDQVMTRPTSPEVAEQEQRTQENEEDVLMTDFQLLNIPDASCLPWVSTLVPFFDGNGNASDSNVFLPPGVSCIVQCESSKCSTPIPPFITILLSNETYSVHGACGSGEGRTALRTRSTPARERRETGRGSSG